MAEQTIDEKRRAEKLAERREANRQRSARWYEANKDRISIEAKAKYAADPGPIKARNRVAYRKHREKRLAAEKKRRQDRLEETRAKERVRAQKRYAANKAAHAERQKRSRTKRAEYIRVKMAQYRLQNRERIREQSADYRRRTPGRIAQWLAANPEKAKAITQTKRARKAAAEGRHTAADITRIYNDQRGKCAYCRCSIRSAYHEDHIVPLSKGGSNWPNNIQLLCQNCNQRKHAKHPLDFARELGRLL